MNQAHDLAFQLAESWRAKWRARSREMRDLRTYAVQCRIGFEKLDRKLPTMLQQLVDQRRELWNQGIGALRRKPLHAERALPGVTVCVLAFGFKYGVPPNLDLLFDVRILRNPNYVPQLQPLTGDDPDAAAFIAADPALEPFLDRLFALLDFLLPYYAAEERTQLTIGIGCTGGRHRSVYVARRVFDHLRERAKPQGWNVTRVARDLARIA
jgi:UPF0042 nucleotide-binding protein